uniref:Cathepsin S n=1 Tax=Oncorhynchus mykiss TaxID=8022 RepID=A0A8C7NCI4_ONCMY
MMLWSLLLAVLCGTAVALFDPMLEQHWQMWKKTHNKNYQTEVEELGRREVWERNLQLISLHNLEASMDMHTYDLGMNHMGDMTQEEISQSFASLRVPTDLKRDAVSFQVILPLFVYCKASSLFSVISLFHFVRKSSA